MFIGQRYRVSTHLDNIKFSYPTFYGTCACIQTSPCQRYQLVKFTDLTNYYHKSMWDDRTIVIDVHDSINLGGWIFMKLMTCELKQEIQRRKIPTLANLCRKKIDTQTLIEIQGTFIASIQYMF